MVFHAGFFALYIALGGQVTKLSPSNFESIFCSSSFPIANTFPSIGRNNELVVNNIIELVVNNIIALMIGVQ